MAAFEARSVAPGSLAPKGAASPGVVPNGALAHGLASISGSPSHAPTSFTAPRAKATAGPNLIVIAKDGSAAHTVAIGEGLDIGKKEGDVLLPDDAFVSARHARLVPDESGGFTLVDLATANGIYVRLKPIAEEQLAPHESVLGTELRDQDLFLVGQQVLEFRVVNESEEGFGPARERGTLVFGTPITPRYARLMQRSVEGICRDVFHIRKVETVLGRESGDIVFTDDPFLSRKHAAVRIDRETKRFFLADLGSSNGTFVRIRGQARVRPGDEFRVGQQLFRIDGSVSPAPSPAPPPAAPPAAPPAGSPASPTRGELRS